MKATEEAAIIQTVYGPLKPGGMLLGAVTGRYFGSSCHSCTHRIVRSGDLPPPMLFSTDMRNITYILSVQINTPLSLKTQGSGTSVKAKIEQNTLLCIMIHTGCHARLALTPFHKHGLLFIMSFVSSNRTTGLNKLHNCFL